jgi:hypothetical protein
MGISRMTLYHIQESRPEDLEILTGQVEKGGKFGAELFTKDGQGRPRRLLSTGCTHNSKEEAKIGMEEIVQQCRDAEPAFGGGS